MSLCTGEKQNRLENRLGLLSMLGFVVRHLRWKGAASPVLVSRSRAMPVWRPAVPCPTASAGSQRWPILRRPRTAW